MRFFAYSGVCSINQRIGIVFILHQQRKAGLHSSVSAGFFWPKCRNYGNLPIFSLSNLLVSFANQTLKRKSISGSASFFCSNLRGSNRGGDNKKTRRSSTTGFE